MIRKFLFSCCVLVGLFLGSIQEIEAQFGIGIVGGVDLYQRYTNPTSNLASESAGSFLLNLSLGPKIWIGGKQFSLSVEAPASIAPLGLAVKDYKGLGMAAVPVIGMLNFGKTSGFNRDGGVGFSIGGGIQWYRTELFGLNQDFEDIGVERAWEQVYIIQTNLGFGISGFAGNLFIRYGFDTEDIGLRTLNVGVQTDFNFLMTKNIDDPASRL